MSRKKIIDRNELYRLYITEQIGFYDICKHFGVSDPTLSKALKEYAIPLRQGARKKLIECPDLDKLQSLSRDTSISNSDIARAFDVSLNVINRWFTENNIDRAFRYNGGKKPSREDLEKAYQSKSANQLAKDYGVTARSVILWLQGYGITTRGIKETGSIMKEKARETNLEKYGYEWSFQIPSVKEKIKKTHLRKRGVEYPSQCQEVRQKVQETVEARYGVPNTFYLVQSPSRGECELIDRLNALGFNLRSTRSILRGHRELDGYDEDKKIAVEYCGLYWHSEKFKDRNYHRDKFVECRDQGIRLYTIFEDEWANISDKIVRYIYMNNHTSKTIIGARKTTCDRIPKEIARTFCDTHHIQGATHSITDAFGLFHESELLSVMTFGKHHRGREGMVMNRFCSTGTISVMGGASKLISHAAREFHCPITTWSDNRYSNGNVYARMGCQLDAELPPDYSWADCEKLLRHAKQSRKKSATGQPREITEKDYNESLGLARIWDCGKIRWIYPVILAPQKPVQSDSGATPLPW